MSRRVYQTRNRPPRVESLIARLPCAPMLAPTQADLNAPVENKDDDDQLEKIDRG